jgi:hypothetical protein
MAAGLAMDVVVHFFHEIRDDCHDLGHASMVALSGRSVKRGKLGCDQAVPPNFPVFASRY